MYHELTLTVNGLLNFENISEDRKATLQPLINFVQEKVAHQQEININFICTHNSRRSHFSQIWAQVAAEFFGVQTVRCYSGGTEETALFPMVATTLVNQGIRVFTIADTLNLIYAIKYGENLQPIIGFSKKYDNPFNPVSGFAAVMTCSQADVGCPFVAGSERRIPITYEDPKSSDNTDQQSAVYEQRSLEIAQEMLYVFSSIKK